MSHRTEFSIRSDDIIKNFVPMQGTESARFTIFRLDSVGRLKGRSDERWSVALPPFRMDFGFTKTWLALGRIGGPKFLPCVVDAVQYRKRDDLFRSPRSTCCTHLHSGQIKL